MNGVTVNPFTLDSHYDPLDASSVSFYQHAGQADEAVGKDGVVMARLTTMTKERFRETR